MAGDLALSARVILVGKPGCHLCDVAREVVEVVCAQTDTDFVEISIRDDPRLSQLYADQVPVVLVDGAVHDVYRVNPQRLAAALAP
ncbi:MAG: glutaredoxin family protein [Micrococcales bacterium]|nr:glutaredoxin family protein [Micrococcales bacterium]